MDPLLASASVVFGLIFGSFLNVCIYRLPRDLSVLNPRWSACPECKKPIAFYDNIPVLSWLLLRGRCRQCKEPISPRYLMVEVLNAVLFLACCLVLRLDSRHAEILHARFPVAGPDFHRRGDEASS